MTKLQKSLDRALENIQHAHLKTIRDRSKFHSGILKAKHALRTISEGNLEQRIASANLNSTEKSQLSRDLDGIAEMATFIGTYIESGTWQRAQERTKKVRKALGYTHP